MATYIAAVHLCVLMCLGRLRWKTYGDLHSCRPPLCVDVLGKVEVEDIWRLT